MGNGIAHVFAQYGFKVNLIDVSQPQLDKAIEIITKNLDRQISKGAISGRNKKENTKKYYYAYFLTGRRAGSRPCCGSSHRKY